uniref:Uncharacterized protein n=1 Tax=Chenopodium quinoa TaxID=63459 RepID=A0A803MQC8_CHEQI
MSPESSKFHPALTITNVKSLIPITLDDQGMYHSWATLFKVLVRVHDLYHHIVPPTEATKIAAYQATKAADPALWRRLDAAVLNWIYGNISPDLLHAILLKDDTAQGAWARLESMFQDNKASRATHLEEELVDLVFENFSSIDAYCNHIKSLADRLADVDAPLSDNRLVLKLTAGLPEAYAGTVDIIQNQESLPSFESCRSCLKLAERTIKNRLAKEGGPSNRNQALVTSTVASNSASSSSNHSASKGGKQKKFFAKCSGKGRNPNSSLGDQQQTHLNGPHVPYNWPQSPWAYAPWAPPCPYPASLWAPKPPAAQPSRPRRLAVE